MTASTNRALVETDFGRIAGVSYAPHDSIMAAGRYLAANGFVDDQDHAIFLYDNSNRYVWAVNDYAAVQVL